MFETVAKPWGTKQLTRLGKSIRDGADISSTVPSYRDVMAWFNDLSANAAEHIRSSDWTPILGHIPHEVTARPKTIDTLRQKLQRDPSTPLPNVQDLAGVRFEADITLVEQDAVARQIAVLFDHDPEDSKVVHDLRDRPHSGYRAVHVWLRLPAGRVEVQVRTVLQGEWANAYERAGDVFGRGIRYDEVHSDPEVQELVDMFKDLSVESLAGLENRMLSFADLSHSEQIELVENKLAVVTSLRAIADRLQQMHQRKGA